MARLRFRTFQRFNVLTFRRLLVPLVPDDLEHAFRIRRLFESLPELGPVQEFGNVRQRMQMLLELALRHKEQHHKVHGLIVQGIETDSLLDDVFLRNANAPLLANNVIFVSR